MKKTHSNSITLYGGSLLSNINYNLDIYCNNSNPCIIKGIVSNSDSLPLVGAAIEIKETDPTSNVSTILGYCFSNNYGEYVIGIYPKPTMYYEIFIYSPLC